MSINFFESVDKHNIERFHSECLTWIFNNYHDCTKEFICKVKTIGNAKTLNIQIITVLSEISNMDIIIDYKIDNKKERIIIENKIKSTEHFIGNQSQTEYYYDNHNDGKTSFVYLTKFLLNKDEIIKSGKIPAKELNSIKFDFIKQNIWRKPDNNPWITISYENLCEILKSKRPLNKSNSNVIFNEYINYISKWNYNASDYLHFNSSSSMSAKDKNGFNFLYYTLLFYLLLAKLEKKSSKIIDYYSSVKNSVDFSALFYYFKSGSANSSDPLFAFFRRIKIDNISKKYFEITNTKKCEEIYFINVGIQMQGDTIKYYTSIDDKDYDFVTTTDRDGYMYYSKKTFFKEDILKEISNNFSLTKSNNCKTKTFYSKSFQFKDFEKNDIKVNLELIDDVVAKFLKIKF